MHRTRLFRRLHRWLGFASAAFLVLLAATGFLLNHSTQLGLDRTLLEADWLLDMYGVKTPQTSAAYPLNQRWVLSLGSSLYLDDNVLAREASELVGAAATATYIVAATADALFIANTEAELVDRVDTDLAGVGQLQAIGTDELGLVIRTSEADYRYDIEAFTFTPLPSSANWRPGPPAEQPPDELLERLRAGYRGAGINVERLLLDLHSGRIIGLTGTLLFDLVALSLVILAASGVYLWFRSSR